MTGTVPVVAAVDRVERLASLFDAHYARLYRLARRLAPTTDDALDLVQETFLRATRFPNSIPAGAAGEEAWLVRVLVNIRRDQWRKASTRDRLGKLRPGAVRSLETSQTLKQRSSPGPRYGRLWMSCLPAAER